MDTKGWIVVVLCAVGMVLYFPVMQRDMARKRVVPAAESGQNAGADSKGAKNSQGGAVAEGQKGGAEGQKSPPSGAVPEKTSILRSQVADFHMTNVGAGISTASLLDHTQVIEGDGAVTLNRHGTFPVGTLGEGDADGADLEGYEVTKEGDREIIFEKVNADGVRVTKRFYLNPSSEKDGYVVNLDVSFKNEDSRPYRRSDLWLYTGALGPLHAKEWPQQTGFFWRDDDKMHFKDVNKLEGKGFMGMGDAKSQIVEGEEMLKWAGVMDQFYAIVFAGAEPEAGSIWARRTPIELKGAEEAPKKPLFAAEGAMSLPEVRLAPGEVESFSYEIYLGPKEYKRLVDLGNDRREIMNYGNFPVLGAVVKHVSRFLMKALVAIAGVVGNYGVAIIIITICIRILIWPLHAKSTRTMKRMAALSPMMTEMREKYKDDPQKLNTEMMQLYRDYGVNPMGGCLPVFLQLPIFLGFYRMLQSAVELRHEGFIWWVKDLSMPDTVFTLHLPFQIPLIGISDVDLNILPLLMGITMVLQMKVAPKSGDKMQQRIFMFMPLIFLFICYNFASALALYWTTQNIFSIGQTWYMSRRPEPELQKVTSKKKGGTFSDMMQQAKDRTKNMEKGPQQTKSKADQKKKRRK